MTRTYPLLHEPLIALPFLHAGSIRAQAPQPAMPQGVMRRSREIDDPSMRVLWICLAIGVVEPERHRRYSHSG